MEIKAITEIAPPRARLMNCHCYRLQERSPESTEKVHLGWLDEHHPQGPLWKDYLYLHPGSCRSFQMSRLTSLQEEPSSTNLTLDPPTFQQVVQDHLALTTSFLTHFISFEGEGSSSWWRCQWHYQRSNKVTREPAPVWNHQPTYIEMVSTDEKWAGMGVPPPA